MRQFLQRKQEWRHNAIPVFILHKKQINKLTYIHINLFTFLQKEGVLNGI